MTARRLALSLALALAPVPAFGQGFSRPPGLPPSVTPAMITPTSFGFPGAFGSSSHGYGRFNGVGAFYGGFGGYGSGVYGYYPGPFGGYGSGGYGYYPGPFSNYGYPWAGLDTTLSAGSPQFAPPLQGTAPSAVDPAAASVDMPAAGEVTFEFPAEVALTVDGIPVPGTGRERTVTSKALRPGQEARLAVRATWTSGGERYEWDRVVTVARGGRSRLTVARGFPAK